MITPTLWLTQEKEFVVGEAHTNAIEGFGSAQRMTFGICHFVSAKYLQRYIDEAVFRYNTRKESEGERFQTMFAKAIGIVRYKDVVKYPCQNLEF